MTAGRSPLPGKGDDDGRTSRHRDTAVIVELLAENAAIRGRLETLEDAAGGGAAAAAVEYGAAIAAGLRDGFENGDLHLYLQPIVGADRSVLGFEALVRWEGEDRVLVPPADFVPVAEYTGLIVDIDAWMLEEVCRLLASWSKNERSRELFIAVNVSEQQLRSGCFAEQVRSALARHGVRPQLLGLEVLENMIQRDIARTIEALNELRADGHEISLDDFGVGYSSLGRLKRLPVQNIKIDRSFVEDVAEDPLDVAIVEAIVHIARAIGMSATAEGVETEEQFARLQSLGVDRYQGFLFGRPGPVEAVRFC